MGPTPFERVDGWTTPLYIFASDNNDDLAVLSDWPSFEGSGPYTQLFNGPVGYISPSQTDIADTPLFSFFSAERKDANTHTRTAAEEGYSEGVLLGYISSKPWSGDSPGSVRPALHCPALHGTARHRTARTRISFNV